MATKKNVSKSSGKSKTSKKVTPKGRLASNKKSSTKKVVTKAKPAKAKKAATSKKPMAKSKKSTASTKKAKPAVASKKKVASLKKSTAKATKSPSSVKKAKSTVGVKKKPTATASQVKKKKSSISQWNVASKVASPKQQATRNVISARTPVAKKPVIRKSSLPAKTTPSSRGASQLSPQERYNAGGLCACVIETSTKDGQDRLHRVLQHLGLSDMDQANLFRVSQGVRIPKLFADGLRDDESRRTVLHALSQFTKSDDPSGKRWKTELEDLARLLGG